MALCEYSLWNYLCRRRKKKSQGDVVTAIEHCIKKLKDDMVAKEDRAFFSNYWYILWLMSTNLACEQEEDRGGNGIRLRWRGGLPIYTDCGIPSCWKIIRILMPLWTSSPSRLEYKSGILHPKLWRNGWLRHTPWPMRFMIMLHSIVI